MKKLIAILAISTIFAGCTNADVPASSKPSSSEPSQETQETKETMEEKQVIEMEAAEDSPEEAEGKVVTAETEEKPSQEEQEETKENKEEEAEKENEKEDSKEDSKEESEKDKKEEEKTDKKSPIGENDLMFLPYSTMVRLGKDGRLTDENGDEAPAESAYQYAYVKYTNNIFVKNEPLGKYWIVRMNGSDMTTLFEFPANEGFTPLGMIGDRIYGYHTYTRSNEDKNIQEIDYDKSAIGFVDLATGKVSDFEATRNKTIGGSALIDGILQYSIPGDNYQTDAYNFDLMQLDLSKGTDQEPELIEKDFNLQYLFGQKRFIDGKADWQIRRADNEHIYVGDKTFPFLWAEQGFQEFIGNNIFYFTTGDASADQFDPFLRHLKIVDTNTGETILEEDIRGMKLIEGKLYYLDKDAKVKDIGLSL